MLFGDKLRLITLIVLLTIYGSNTGNTSTPQGFAIGSQAIVDPSDGPFATGMACSGTRAIVMGDLYRLTRDDFSAVAQFLTKHDCKKIDVGTEVTIKGDDKVAIFDHDPTDAKCVSLQGEPNCRWIPAQVLKPVAPATAH